MKTDVHLDAEMESADVDIPFGLCLGMSDEISIPGLLLALRHVPPPSELAPAVSGIPRVTMEHGVGGHAVRIRACFSDGRCFYDATLDTEEWSESELLKHAKNLRLRALRRERRHLKAI